ncbi:MAG: DUF973 family protein [Desulfurococcaceae archaeon]
MSVLEDNHGTEISIVIGIKRLERTSLSFAIISMLLLFSQSLSSNFVTQVFAFINAMYEGILVQEEMVEKLTILIREEAMNLLISGVILIASFILSLLSLFRYGLPGFSDLRKWRSRDFSSGVFLFKVGSIGGLVSLTLAITTLSHIIYIICTTFSLSEQSLLEMALSGISLLVGLILVLLGSIGVTIVFFKLGKISGIRLFYVPGVLLLIGVLLSILTTVYDLSIFAIAWILAYIAFRSLHKSYPRLKMTENTSLPFPE